VRRSPTGSTFQYERLKRAGKLMRYASPNALRTPRALIDPDGDYTAARVSTMVIAYRADAPAHPETFRELGDPRWKGEVALGDPLTSGTAFTWALTLSRTEGEQFFAALRQNDAVVAGGNAAVQQKLESGERRVGVLLLENALSARAKGSPLRFAYPRDGAVIIPGPIAILGTTRHPVAAKALYDLLLSPEAQRIIVETGDMHGVDPRLPGPRGEDGLEQLLARSRSWDEPLVSAGLDHGEQVKAAFARAFAQ
jgi:iron(III) transport system substrate-binding protein